MEKVPKGRVLNDERILVDCINKILQLFGVGAFRRAVEGRDIAARTGNPEDRPKKIIEMLKYKLYNDEQVAAIAEYLEEL